MGDMRWGHPGDGAGDRSLPPGPRLPKLVQALRYSFDWPRLSRACADQYGASWTLRLPGFPPSVVTTDRDAIRNLFTGDPLTKRHANDLLQRLFGPGSILMLEPAEHLARRRLELPAFHGDRIENYRDGIAARLLSEMETWQTGSVIAMHGVAKNLTLSVILELAIGVDDQKLLADLRTVLLKIMRPHHSIAMFLPAQLSERWNPLARPVWSALDELHRLLELQVERTRRAADLQERNDVLASLIQAQDADGRGLTTDELREELVTLIIAGHETTSKGIAWGAELLAHHPQVVARLRSTLAEGDRSYLNATAKEVLRLRTVLPVTAARQPLDDFEVGGHLLPRGTLVLVNADGLHHDARLYEAPGAFRPERFLDGQPEQYAYLPFGGGARRCIGASLAHLELEVALETIVTRFDLAPTGPPAQPVRVGTTMAPNNEARVRVVPVAAKTNRELAHA